MKRLFLLLLCVFSITFVLGCDKKETATAEQKIIEPTEQVEEPDKQPAKHPAEQPAEQIEPPVEEPTIEPAPEPAPTCEYDYMEYVWNGCYDTFQLVRPGGCGYDWEENGVCYSYNCIQDGGTIDYSCSEQYNKPGENECPPGYELHEGYCFMN